MSVEELLTENGILLEDFISSSTYMAICQLVEGLANENIALGACLENCKSCKPHKVAVDAMKEMIKVQLEKSYYAKDHRLWPSKSKI